MQTIPEQSLRVGPDRVWIEGRSLIILARHPMPDWTVREHQRVAIYFQEQKFFLLGRRPAEKPFAIRYELTLWPEHDHEQSARFIHYDEEYVKARESAHRREAGFNVTYAVLMPFYPLLGFCWSGFKDRVLTRCGFAARSITGASLILAFNFCILEGILVGWLRDGLILILLKADGWLWLDWTLLSVVALDTMARLKSVASGDTCELPGFLEWLWPRRRRA